MRVFSIFITVVILSLVNCGSQNNKQESGNTLAVDSTASLYNKLKECATKSDSIQLLLQLARISAQTNNDSTSFLLADKIIALDPKNPYPFFLIKRINSTRKYASAGISGFYEMISDDSGTTITKCGATMHLLITDSSVLYYYININNCNSCSGEVTDSAFFFNSSNAISYPYYSKTWNTFSKISFSFKGDTVFVDDKEECFLHGCECGFTGKYLKMLSGLNDKESSKNEPDKINQNSEQTSDSTKDKYALIICQINHVLNEAICLYGQNIYECKNFYNGAGTIGNVEFVDGFALTDDYVVNSDTECKFYITKGNINKHISPWSITHYSEVEDSIHSIDYRLQISANINGQEYNGKLIINNCYDFFIYKARVATEEIFGEKHYTLHDIKKIQEWP